MKQLSHIFLGLAFLGYMMAAFGGAVAHQAGQGGKDPMAQFDTNGDGKLSKDEFLAGHASLFTEIDTDGDGYISREEAKARLKARRARIKARRDALRGANDAQQGEN